MTEQQRKYLISLAAELASDRIPLESVPSSSLREMILAIDEEMGRPSDPEILVDHLLAGLGVRWIPEGN